MENSPPPFQGQTTGRGRQGGGGRDRGHRISGCLAEEARHGAATRGRQDRAPAGPKDKEDASGDGRMPLPVT